MLKPCPWCNQPAHVYAPFPGASKPRFNIECEHDESCPIRFIGPVNDIMSGFYDERHAVNCWDNRIESAYAVRVTYGPRNRATLEEAIADAEQMGTDFVQKNIMYTTSVWRKPDATTG